MSIRGDKPNGYFIKTGTDGKIIQGETRQCAHCQFTWEYRPGSGRRYGMCLSCHGIICDNVRCKLDQEEKLEYIVYYHPELHLNCIRFNDWNDLLAEDQLRIRGAKQLPNSSVIAIPGQIGEDLTLTRNGIIVSRK